MTETFVSNINGEINYNFEFDDQKLNEQDNGLKSFIYKITIFGNTHHIAMGNKKLHVVDNTIAYFPVYLIYKNKVVSKIGVYEENNEQLDGEPMYESMDLLLHPKYYKPPFVLDQFVIDDDEDESADVVDRSMRLDEPEAAVNTGESIVLEDGTINAERNPNIVETYEMIKAITNNGMLFAQPEERGIFRSMLRLVEKVFAVNLDDPDKVKTMKENVLAFRKKTIRTQKTDQGKKLEILFHSLIAKYNVDNKLSYKVNEVVLSLLEIYTNTKFILLDKDSKMYTFSVFGDSYSKGEDPEMKQFRDYIIGEETDPTKLAKLERTIEKVVEYFVNFNPDKFVFLQKVDGKFYVCNINNNDGPIINVQSMDPKFLYHLKELVDKENHEFIEESQMSNLKMNFEIKLKDYVDVEPTPEGLDTEDKTETAVPVEDDEENEDKQTVEEEKPDVEASNSSSVAQTQSTETPKQKIAIKPSAANTLDNAPDEKAVVEPPKPKIALKSRGIGKLARLKAKEEMKKKREAMKAAKE